MIHRLFGTGNRPSYFSPADARVNGLLDVACQPREAFQTRIIYHCSLSLSLISKRGTLFFWIERRKFMEEEGSIHKLYSRRKRNSIFQEIKSNQWYQRKREEKVSIQCDNGCEKALTLIGNPSFESM